MKEGVAYLRVSTIRQEQGASLDTQRAAISDYAASNGITIIHEYCDILSGTRDDRPRYQAMLASLSPGQIVMVWRLDRIGRKKSELFRFFEWCKKHRIGLVSVTQPEMSNELARDIMSVLAAYESQQIAERSKPNMLRRVEEGKWVSRPPRWYSIGPAGHLVPTEDSHEAQRVWDAVLATGSIEAAAAAYDINTISLRATLKKRAYLGETVWDGVVVTGTHPAIVRRATWEAVDAMRRERDTKQRREHIGTALLTGFIYVGDSERRMYHYMRRGKRRQRRYYVTTTGDHGPRVSVRAEDAERAALDALKGLDLSEGERREIEREMRERARDDPHKRERARIARKIAALDAERIETARMEARRRITPAEADRMRADQERERTALDARLASLPPPWDASSAALLRLRLRLAERIDAAYEAGNVAALRLLIEAFIARVEVYGGETGEYWRQPDRDVRVIWRGGDMPGEG